MQRKRALGLWWLDRLRHTGLNIIPQKLRVGCESLEGRVLLSAIPLPNIPAALFNVAAYGAHGDGVTDNTSVIQSAINAASAAGGGTVEIPAAVSAYESGPFTLANNINL